MSNVENVENKSGTLMGKVVSDNRQQTLKVKVSWSRRHERYGKVIKKDTTFHVHDPESVGKVGDLVEIKQVRPISKTKTWQLVQVIEKAE
ncbi:30S ribosomal protein S17 [Candidatus Berkiella aquae]|uniref:Small ribosomal subunit protein uS17 n=1 Tax=Candidatus Berkiella aquae TaxID=295108 RepID=A0A0Q9YPG0_9GAMM|nr:30S ribosomal protein S17 [Candidatus Berkiella aquae]MCS5710273.1 30S ribosomal protein S17 [Candidatus Berkiella aquae]